MCETLVNNKKLIGFEDINVSVLVEKDVNGKKIPLPLVILKTNKKSAEEIGSEITAVKSKVLDVNENLSGYGNTVMERIYYHLPGFLRRFFWKWMLANPKIAFKKMGNVAITSVGNTGDINGWFIHTSVHTLSFGLGSVIKKPIVKNGQIVIRQMLHLTLLFDHNVIDGAPMARFVRDLNRNIENSESLIVDR